MRRRKAALVVPAAPEKLLVLYAEDWLHGDDPQPDGTKERAEERMVWARQRQAAARREWAAEQKTAGRTLPEINAALFPTAYAPAYPDPRRSR
jgi:hypothetical protein